MRWRLVSLLLLTFMLAACGGASPPSPQTIADVTATDVAVAPPKADTSSLDCGPSKPVRQDIPLIRNTVENTNGGMKGAFVRSMAFDSYNHAVWLGYGLGVGVGNYDGSEWRFCMKLQHVNAVLVRDGIVYAGTDTQAETEGEAHGFWVLRNGLWQDYTASLPDSRVFGIFEDDMGILVGTWEGMARVDLNNFGPWEVVYSTAQNGVSNHIHAYLKDKDGDVWIGSVANGVYWYTGGRWLHVVSYDTPNLDTNISANPVGHLPGNNVRDILQAPDGFIWIATEAIHGGTEVGQKGGITGYSPLGGWITYTSEFNGGADRVMDLAIDPQGRLWAASKDKGTLMLQNNRWTVVDPTPSNAIVFGNGQVYIGTDGFGLIIMPM